MKRRELLWLYDLDGIRVGAIGHDFFDLWTDERFRQSEQMIFEIAATHPKAPLIGLDREVIHRGRAYFVTELEEVRDGTATTLHAECDALWYRLADLTFVGTFLIEDRTPAQGLADILDGTGWIVDELVTTSTETFSLEMQDRSRLELLRAWERVTGLFLRFDTVQRSVNLVDFPGAATGVSFRYARNITGVRKRRRPPAITVLYPYGADGLSIAGVNGGEEFLEDFTYYTDQGLTLDEARAQFTRSEVWSDSSIIREADLLAAAQARLAVQAAEETGYEVDVVDLSEQTGVEETATLRTGDTVRVFDPDLGDDVRPIVTRLRRHWLDPVRNRIELGTIPNPLSNGAASSRGNATQQWLQFVGPVSATFTIRNDATFSVARIPLRFRTGGRANYHLDLFATGVGAGDMLVEVFDTVTGLPVFKQLSVPYTDGATVRASMSWATEELDGSHNYRVRVSTIADGGPSPTNGVDIVADATDPFESSWWILAQGAVQESPRVANSVTFLPNGTNPNTGSAQSWTVPDNVEEITIECHGGKGGQEGPLSPGIGARIAATFPVVPGDMFDIFVGKHAATSGGWPNGGSGEGGPNIANNGGGGGGSTSVRPAGSAFADSYVVAAGGGGTSEVGGSAGGGGNGGWVLGATGGGQVIRAGKGATQTVAGAGGTGTTNSTAEGEAGSFGQGGDAAQPDAAVAIFRRASGGGGGGWYGGGGGGVGASENGGGGGGSSWVSPIGTVDEVADGGAVEGNPNGGKVVISWADPT